MSFELGFSNEIFAYNLQICEPENGKCRAFVLTDITTPLPNFDLSIGYHLYENGAILTIVQYFYIHLEQMM
jgi:hypothetical protein